MTVHSARGGKPPHVLMIVANDVTVDTRVRKMAVAMAASGLRVTVLGMSSTGARTEAQLGGATIVRVPVPLVIKTLTLRHKAQGVVPPALRPGYANKDEVVAGKTRRVLWERELQAAEGRRLLRRDAGGSGLPAPVDKAVDVLDRARLKAWRLAVRPRRYAVKGRQYLFKRRVDRQKSMIRYAGRADLARLWLKVPVAGDWRHSMPEAHDYEMAFGPVVDELAPDIIHAHDVHLIGVAARAVARARRKGRRIKWIYDAHEYIPGLARFRPRELAGLVSLEREYIRQADRVMTVSEPIAEELQRSFHLPQRPRVVMNIPVMGKEPGTPGTPSVREAAGLARDVPLLVYSGGIDKTRGVDTLVEALRYLPGVHVALVAKAYGGYMRQLEAIAEEAGARDRLHIVPFVDPDEVVAYLSSATVGVHTLLANFGNHEVALPNKYFEYMHARLPLLVSNCRAMRELTHQLGIGEDFVSGDPKSLAESALKILADRDRYVRPYAERPEILHEYSWARQEDILREIYQELVDDIELSTQPADVVSLAEEPLRGGRRAVDLAIGPVNMAGQGWAWAKALERSYAGVRAHVFALEKKSKLVFPADNHISVRDWKSLDWQVARVRRILSQQTHVLLESGRGAFGTLNGEWFDGDLPALRQAGLGVALVLHGSEVRSPRVHRELEPASPFADPEGELSLAQQAKVDELLARLEHYDGPLFVSTLDLLDYVPRAAWLPVVVDTSVWTPGPAVLERDRPVVVHAASNPRLKGSAEVGFAAEQLAQEGLIDYRLLEEIPVDEMPAAIASADIVLDQFALGDYGVLAVQALATGRLVLGHVADRVRERVGADLPIVETTPATLREVVVKLLDDRDAARATAAAGVDFVRRFHDGERSSLVLGAWLGLGEPTA